MQPAETILFKLHPDWNIFLQDPNRVATQLIQAGMKEAILACAQVSDNKEQILKLLNDIK